MEKQISNSIGCLLIHGFCGNTKEVEYLAAYLEERGFLTTCTELKGHTGNRKDLSKTTYNDWIKSAEDSLLELQEKCERVIIVGFSMGGLITANLLLKYEAEIAAFISTPVYLFDFKRILKNLFSSKKNDGKGSFLKRYFKAWTTTPFKAMINFIVLLLKTRGIFKGISCPTFVAQGLMDDTVNWMSAEYICKAVGAKRKVLKHYKDAEHLIIMGGDKDAVCRDLYEFVVGEKVYQKKAIKI